MSSANHFGVRLLYFFGCGNMESQLTRLQATISPLLLVKHTPGSPGVFNLLVLFSVHVAASSACGFW